MIALVAVLLLTGCGVSATSNAANPSPTPIPSPTPDVGKLYIAAINVLRDSTLADGNVIAAAPPGSAAESTAAMKLAGDFQTLLDALDAIPFPAPAATDLSAFRKAVVASQVFWSNVSIDTSTYSQITDNVLTNDYNQTGILLGHDVGVSLVLQKSSPTPS